MFNPIEASVQDLQQRISYVEHKMDDAFSAQNNLVDVYKNKMIYRA